LANACADVRGMDQELTTCKVLGRRSW
jgi:hypothetical protein